MNRKKFRSLEEVREIVAKMRASGLSRWAFAKAEGICYTRLAGFEKRVARAGAGGGGIYPGKLAVLRKKRKKIKDKQAFVEVLPLAVPGSGSFFLLCGRLKLEFSLGDLGFVLSELEKDA